MLHFLRWFCAAVLGGLITAGVLIYSTTHAPSSWPQDQNMAPALVAHQITLPSPEDNLTGGIDLRYAARVAAQAVVFIEITPDDSGRETVKALFTDGVAGPLTPSTASGVIYTSDGHIVTNYHTIAGSGSITVNTSDGKRYPASVMGYDRSTDIAVLKIEGENFPILRLADSDAVEPGQWVLAVGNPRNLNGTVTAGIISATGRALNINPGLDAIESFLQTDAVINPGNSGGALVDVSGQLVGINTAIATRNGNFQGYGFAIPIQLARRVADDIIAYGKYRRPYIGIEISSFIPQDHHRLSVSESSYGVVIDSIFAGGAAQAAQLKRNDLIIRVNDRPIKDIPDITEIFGRATVGDQIHILYVRQGQERTTTLVIPPFSDKP